MVYLVDDDYDDLEFVQEAFERIGFNRKFVWANNGEEFMSRLQRSNLPELVVLDLNMPLKDGFEVLFDLKNSSRFSEIPVVVLTASYNKQDELRCVTLGCNLFLKKPSELGGYDTIVTTILEYLRNFETGKLSTAQPEG